MDIVHLIFQMLTGGMETMLADIANEQVARGHNVEIVIVNRGEDANVMAAIDPRVKITRFNRKPGAAPLLLMLRLNAWLLRRRPDVIHAHLPKLVGLTRVMRKRMLFTVHDINTPLRYARGVNMAAISSAVLEDVVKRMPNASIKVVANGINVNKIIKRPHKEIGKTINIVQISRLVADKKGQDILIDAVWILRGRGYDVSATFVGGGPDMDVLKERSGDLPVHFTGNLSRTEIYSMLKDFDIMCHPARYEGFGLTVAEGMAAGLPLVVPEGGGPWEVADSGRLARTFRNGSAESCADALQYVIDNYTEALRIAEKAKDYVEKKYSVGRMVTEYEELYKSLKK